MEHSTLMKCGNYFALCKNCDSITCFKFVKCHKCLKNIDKKKYKQASHMNKYNTLIKSLMTFEINVLEDCHSTLTISIEGDKSYAPELHQIWKDNDKYTYFHYEKNTHNILEKYEVDLLSFILVLNSDQTYKISLIYGPNVIYVHP